MSHRKSIKSKKFERYLSKIYRRLRQDTDKKVYKVLSKKGKEIKRYVERQVDQGAVRFNQVTKKFGFQIEKTEGKS